MILNTTSQAGDFKRLTEIVFVEKLTLPTKFHTGKTILKNLTGENRYMLFASWEVRIVKNCERGLENAASGRRRKAAFSSPRSQLFTLGPVYIEGGCPANRATRSEGLKHSPPLHATHLTGTVSGLHELSLERPLSTINITADQGNFFPSYFSFLNGHGPVLCLRLVYYIDLFRLTVILFGR